MTSGSAGRAGAAGCAATAPPCAASSPARKPASQARCTGVAGPTTRLRRSISSSAKGAVFGMGDIQVSSFSKRSARDREKVIDDRERDEKSDSDPEAPADQLFLDRQQRLRFGFRQLARDI